MGLARAEELTDQEAAAAGVDEEDELDDEDEDEEEEEEEDDVEESDDVEDDVASAFLVSEPFDFSALTPPARESLR